jgi:chromate transport protein ChrA
MNCAIVHDPISYVMTYLLLLLTVFIFESNNDNRKILIILITAIMILNLIIPYPLLLIIGIITYALDEIYNKYVRDLRYA